MRELIFLKLGGSLITDKTRPYAVRLEKLEALVKEIDAALSRDGDLRLLLGHGSGSFGHFAVKEHLLGRANPFAANGDGSTRIAYWRGYSEVRYRAAELNRYVMDAMRAASIPAVSLQPSAMVTARDGSVSKWDLTSLKAALDTSLVPVIYGDIVFDAVLGGTVLSTESLMIHLVPHLQPQRILLMGIEDGVWADYPDRQHRIERITPGSYAEIAPKVGASHGTDVTGGMRAKVEEMLALVARVPGLTIQILSGEEPGNLMRALGGAHLGTILASD